MVALGQFYELQFQLLLPFYAYTCTQYEINNMYITELIHIYVAMYVHNFYSCVTTNLFLNYVHITNMDTQVHTYRRGRKQATMKLVPYSYYYHFIGMCSPWKYTLIMQDCKFSWLPVCLCNYVKAERNTLLHKFTLCNSL